MNDTNHVAKNALMLNMNQVVNYATRKLESTQLLQMAVERARTLLLKDGDISWPVRCFLLDLADSGVPNSIAFDIRLNLASTKMLFAKDAHPGDIEGECEAGCSDAGCSETEGVNLGAPVTSFALIDDMLSLVYDGGRMAIDADEYRHMTLNSSFVASGMRTLKASIVSNGVRCYRFADGWIMDDIITGHRAFMGWDIDRQIKQKYPALCNGFISDADEACRSAMTDESVVSATIGVTTVTLRSKDAEVWISKETFCELRWRDGPLLMNGVQCTRLANGWALENEDTGAHVFLDWNTYQGIESENPSIDG
jgi:hypothetical protein